MKFALTGREWKSCIWALAAMPLNNSYNVTRAVLSLFDIGELSDEAIATIKDDERYEADLTCDSAGWGCIVGALGEQPAKNVLPLVNKLLSNVSPEAEAQAKAAGAGV